MQYISTRGDEKRYSASEAILFGLAADGGLLLPEEIPVLTAAEIRNLTQMDYPHRSAFILHKFLSDYSYSELLTYTNQAYSEEKFGEKVCPLVQLNKYNRREFMLELWHGPTAAFKDMALQLLPHLMTAAMHKNGETGEIVILTATSGDTGKAALEGFKDVPGTQLVVYYPIDGVARAQELQMLTSTGDNCHVIGIEGSFDEAQRGVKEIFADQELTAKLAAQGKRLSSANSINWGRLVAQIAYYWSAYADMLASEFVSSEDSINFSVPSGNFGNILAAWYASQMGLPIHKLVCASNRNNVLSDFLQSGSYDAGRDFYKTITPSMDILISSNLERLLFELSFQNSDYIVERMEQLRLQKKYIVGPEMLKRLHEKFVGGFTDDRGVIKTIAELYDHTDHVVDPHTAVAFNVYERYEKRARDEHPVVYVSTASPFKFPASVCRAIFPNMVLPSDELALLQPLAQESGMEIPQGLNFLDQRPLLHHVKIKAQDMKEELMFRLLSNSGN